MSREEFMQWIQHHTNCFPGVRGWMKKNCEDGDITPILNAWYSVVKDVTREGAWEATMRLFRGDEKVPYTSGHPAKIREIGMQIDRGDKMESASRESQTRIIDGQITYGCYACQDTGIRFIVRRSAVENIYKIMKTLGSDWSVKDLKLKGFKASCACPCKSGALHAETRRSKVTGAITAGLPVYNKKTMLEHRPEWNIRQMVSAMVEFYEKHVCQSQDTLYH